MPFAIKAQITGLQGVLTKLGALGRTVRNKILRKVLMEVSKPILQGARAAAPRSTGLLRKSLGRKVKTYRSTGTVVVVVGPRTGQGGTVLRQGAGGKYSVYANPVKYAHLVELGTRPHALGAGASLRRRRLGGAGHPGVPPKKFLTAGYNAASVTATAAQRISEEINKVT